MSTTRVNEQEIHGPVERSSDERQLLPFVSVVMPVRNEAAFIQQSLGAVLAQDYPRDRFEVIVVDGVSDDGTRNTVSRIAREHPNVTLIDNPKRIVATGLNAALRVAKGEIIIRVDGHCEIAQDYVRNCVSHILTDGVEAVGGPLETVGETYIARVIAAAMSSRFGVGGSAFRIANSKTQFADTVPFPAYTRAVINRAGQFDEELVRNQDDEYNYRLRKLGVRILLADDVRSRYYSRATLRRLWRQYLEYGFWKVRVLQKHPRQMSARQFAPPVFVVLLALLIALIVILPKAAIVLALLTSGYALASIIGALLAVRGQKWQVLPLLPFTFLIMHTAYGLGFVFGLIRFSSRWREGKANLPVHSQVRETQS